MNEQIPNKTIKKESHKSEEIELISAIPHIPAKLIPGKVKKRIFKNNNGNNSDYSSLTTNITENMLNVNIKKNKIEDYQKLLSNEISTINNNLDYNEEAIENYNQLNNEDELFESETLKTKINTDEKNNYRNKNSNYSIHLDLRNLKYYEDRIQNLNRNYIGSYAEISSHSSFEFLSDNEFIHEGYRINYSNCEKTSKSLIECHNETGNIWTHLIGSLLFIVLLINTFSLYYKNEFFGNKSSSYLSKYIDDEDSNTISNIIVNDYYFGFKNTYGNDPLNSNFHYYFSKLVFDLNYDNSFLLNLLKNFENIEIKIINKAIEVNKQYRKVSKREIRNSNDYINSPNSSITRRYISGNTIISPTVKEDKKVIQSVINFSRALKKEIMTIQNQIIKNKIITVHKIKNSNNTDNKNYNISNHSYSFKAQYFNYLLNIIFTKIGKIETQLALLNEVSNFLFSTSCIKKSFPNYFINQDKSKTEVLFEDKDYFSEKDLLNNSFLLLNKNFEASYNSLMNQVIYLLEANNIFNSKYSYMSKNYNFFSRSNTVTVKYYKIKNVNNLNNTNNRRDINNLTSYKNEFHISTFSFSNNIYYLSPIGIQIQCLSSIICLLLSTIYHLYNPISKKIFILLRRLDYAGIIIAIMGSTVSAYYYYFFCSNFWRNFYCLSHLIIGILVFLYVVFRSDEYFKIKSYLLVLFVVASFIPKLHILFFLDESIGMTKDAHETCFYLGAIVIGFGFYIFTTKLPEKRFPGKFDFAFHSHQIWHVLVIIGMLFFNQGVYDFYYNRLVHECPITG